MTFAQTRAFLMVFCGVSMAAIVFRIDNFPLTWVPMYAEYEPVEDIHVRVWDRAEVDRGFSVVRRDGLTEQVNADRLNIPRTKFIRLYYERIFGLGPPKDYQSHLALSETNRYLRLMFDPDPATSVYWDWRILYALNKSLGRSPKDKDFIIEARAPALERVFGLADLGDGGGLSPQTRHVTGLARWKPEWSARWSDNDI